MKKVIRKDGIVGVNFTGSKINRPCYKAESHKLRVERDFWRIFTFILLLGAFVFVMSFFLTVFV